MSSPMGTTLFDALDRHARRRSEGHATLSLLLGEPEYAWVQWGQWLRLHGRRVALVEAQDVGALVSAWTTTLLRHREVRADAERFVGLRLRGKTLYERRVLLESCTPPPGALEAWALSRQLWETQAVAPPGVLPEVLREALAREPLGVLRALQRLVPTEALPALGLRVAPGTFAGPRALAAVCVAAPQLTVGCVLSPESFAEHQRQGESRALALMREGRLDVEAPSGEAPDRARSKPEWLLYRMLHHGPRTAGLFTLNTPVQTRDEQGTWEVDLLCRELKLAVEVDGHFHFRDGNAYRRDRRKDVALQREGYLIVRVLAEDVRVRLEELLEELETLIQQRRREFIHGER